MEINKMKIKREIYVVRAPLLCVLASYAVPVSLYGKLWTTPLLVPVPRKVTAATILKNVHG